MYSRALWGMVLSTLAAGCGGEFRATTGVGYLTAETRGEGFSQSLHGVALDADLKWSRGEWARLLSGWTSAWVPSPSAGGRTRDGLLWWYGPLLGIEVHPLPELGIELSVAAVNPTFSAPENDYDASLAGLWRVGLHHRWALGPESGVLAGVQASWFSAHDEEVKAFETDHLVVGLTFGFSYTGTVGPEPPAPPAPDPAP